MSIIDNTQSRMPENLGVFAAERRTFGADTQQHTFAIVWFYLENKTYSEAAAELGLPRGSIAWQLEKARALLAARLARRGITVSATLLAVLLSEAAKGAGVPAVLLVYTIEAARRFTEQAVGALSENVARLVNGGLAPMTKGWTHLTVQRGFPADR